MIRRFAREHGDAALAVALAAAAQVELWFDAERAHDRQLAAPLMLALAATLLVRRGHPVAALAAGYVLYVALGLVQAEGVDDAMSAVFALMVLLYSAGAHAAGRPAATAGGALALLFWATALVRDGESSNVGGVLFFGVFAAAPFLVGRAIRQRRARERDLMVAREAQARAAVREEQARIARELHDAVAHAVSVIVLQARGARHELDGDVMAARTAIDTIERTASQALAEMRRLLAMLRADDESAPTAPQPSLSELETLVADVRAAGLPVRLRVEGTPRELPPGADLSAYRVVQEALTNALKHAGPARASVVVRYRPDAVEVEVADTGAGAANGAGGGHGLAGMRERVVLFGGELESGPHAAGGFVVRARLPL